MGGDALVLRPLHHIGYGDGAAVVGAIESSGALPPGYVLETSGMMEMMDEALADFGEAMCLAAFLTLLTLAAILESWGVWQNFVQPRVFWSIIHR